MEQTILDYATKEDLKRVNTLIEEKERQLGELKKEREILNNILRHRVVENEHMRRNLERTLKADRRMTQKRSEELEALPKGSLYISKRGKNRFCYLSYRKDGRVVKEYLGKYEDVDVEKYRDEIEKRRIIEKERSLLNREIMQICACLGIAVAEEA